MFTAVPADTQEVSDMLVLVLFLLLLPLKHGNDDCGAQSEDGAVEKVGGGNHADNGW